MHAWYGHISQSLYIVRNLVCSFFFSEKAERRKPADGRCFIAVCGIYCTCYLPTAAFADQPARTMIRSPKSAVGMSRNTTIDGFIDRR